MATDAVFISGCYLRADEHRATCPECAARWAAETGGTLRNDQAVATRWAEAAQPAPVWKQGRKGRKRGQPEPENEVPAARRGAAAAAGAGGVQRHRRRVRQQHVQRLLMGVTSWAAFGMHTRAAFAHACMRTCASSDSRLCCMLQRPQKEPFYLGSEITFHIQAPAPQLTERCKSDEWTF